MSELIPIQNNDGIQAVMGRDLHKFLEVKERYTQWIARHVEKYGFSEGQDFIRDLGKSTGGRPSENHILSMDMAKELAMLQGNAKGKQARQYFIECEKRVKQTPALSGKALMAKALIEAQSMLQELEEQNISQRLALVEAQPKIDYHDTFVADSDTLRFSAVASTLGMKESELREILIKHEWIYRETYTRYSRSQGRKVPVHRYSETAHKKRYFFRKLNHDAPRFRDEVMHTLKITPEGATAIERAVKRWRGAQAEIEAA